ncbi:MAG: hypothetical protein U1F27_07340 [Turneriella sp.]
MKDKKKKELSGKLKDKIAQLTGLASGDGAPTLGFELRTSLEKTYENYLLAEARLQSARNEYLQAKGNASVAEDELKLAHKQAKKLLKKQTESAKPAKKNKKAK